MRPEALESDLTKNGSPFAARLPGQLGGAFSRPKGQVGPTLWSRSAVVLTASVVVLLLSGGVAGQLPRATGTTVLAIDQSTYTNEQDNFTVSLEVGSTAGISFVYFTFCQLSSPLCYLPVSMSLHGTNWYVGTTNPMTSYNGMTVGVRAGYNITIVYTDNSNITEPTVPNPFGNLTIATSVTGEYMFQMSVSNQVYGLSGVVNDADKGTPLAGATVSISGPENATTTTGSTGAYAFSGLYNGTYTLAASENGYRTSTQNVVVGGQSLVKDIPIANMSAPLNPNGGGGSSSALSALSPWIVGVVVLVVLVALGALLLGRRKRHEPSSPSAGSDNASNLTPPPR
ncbi:MAG: carboxypeptidase-like regulatory domain-containing protein [Thermoplasmata archaeon]|nr:carboxypeptidase-like regulatory domain-containing protein [Thermoplasmata archaeon]